MAKETKGQQETVERVMHEFKHGELETSAGRKVKSRKQAIAIGLSEAGASNQQSPQEKKKRQRANGTNATNRPGDDGGQSKAELYARARKKDVPGRSKMSKAQLEAALAS